MPRADRILPGFVSTLLLLITLLAPDRSSGAWPPDGTPVCITPEHQEWLSLVADGSGGAIFAWSDARGGMPGIYAQRVDSNGVALWPDGGVLVQASATRVPREPVALPFLGGAVIAWLEQASPGNWDLVAQRLDGSGIRLWAASGVVLSNAPESEEGLALIGNGSSGAFDPSGFYVAWSRVDAAGPPDSRKIVLKAVNSAGAPIWGAGEVIASSSSFAPRSNPAVALDGVGLAGRARGVVLTWNEYYDGIGNDLYAQRVTAGGSVSWASGTSAICTAPGSQVAPLITQLGTQTVVVWMDGRNPANADLYAQRLTSAGAAVWAANGIPVCQAAESQWGQRVVADNAGGVIIAWVDARDLGFRPFAQRLDATGAPLWTTNGVSICPSAYGVTDLGMVPDGVGGAIVAWTDWRNGHANVFAQRVDANGSPSWGPDGRRLSMANGAQKFAALARSGAGAIVGWLDLRSGASDDAYANRVVVTTGTLDVPAPNTLADGLTLESANPARGPVRLRLSLARAATVRAEVLDVSGRRVRTRLLSQVLDAGAHPLTWDGTDDHGVGVPPGLYRVRVLAGGQRWERQVVQLR